MEAQKPLKLFASYAHEDEKYLDELRDWLRPLERQGLIEWWHDRKIVPGWEWEEAIDKNLRSADVILLLVTPTFMASDYVSEKEIDKAIERHERGEARVIPIIARPSYWNWAPFGELQALPRDAKPISTWSNHDEAWLDVMRGIRKAAKELHYEQQDSAGQPVSNQLDVQARSIPRTIYKPLKVSCSYSSRDEQYLNTLKTWLVSLRREGLIKEWHEREIVPSQEWDEVIDEILYTSELILLLITPSFMTSDYAVEKVAKRAVERHERHEASVIPIIVRPTDWERTPFSNLQVLPKNTKPITTWPDQDEAWLDVMRGIRKVAEELGSKPSMRTPAPPKRLDDTEQRVGSIAPRDQIVAVDSREQRVPAEPSAPHRPDVLSSDTIFLSYSRKDWDEFVEPLIIDLRQRGFKVWIDQHVIRGGDNWYRAIQQALETCERMVLCVSPDSLESTYVQREYRYFMARGKWLLPLMCREAAMPWDFEGIQYLPYRDRDSLFETLRGCNS